MDTAPAEQLPPPTVDGQGRAVCCGTGGSWVQQVKEGETPELVLGCQMCRRSATYWRRTSSTAA